MRVGPFIFNSIYQLATESVMDKLRDEGIVMSLFASSGELWDRDTAVITAWERSLQGQSGVHHNVEEILDVALARLETHCWMHQWSRHGRCWSTSSFEQSCETDAGRTEHINCIAARASLKYWRRVMTSGLSMLRALIWNKGRPTEWALQVRKDLETLACQVSGHLTPEEMFRTAFFSSVAQ